jgi:FAS-associated factor 2
MDVRWLTLGSCGGDSKALCTPELSEYLNNSDCIVSWAGCVQHAEGFGVSLSLGCAKFPFLALLTCVSRGINVVEKITGDRPTDVLGGSKARC